MTIFNLVIAIIAIILSSISIYCQFFRKPKLEIYFEDKKPFHKSINIPKENNDFNLESFIRVKVINKRKLFGNLLARNCFGKITKWYTNNEINNEFYPVKLKWRSDINGAITNLAPGESDFIDIFSTNTEESLIIINKIDSNKKQNNFNMKDEHLFKFAVYVENGSPKYKWYKINYIGDRLRYNGMLIKLIEQEEKEVNKIINTNI